jgi:rod shape determining protein RodA
MFLKLINWPISICIILLLSISIVVLLSSDTTLAIQQLLFAIFGIILYLFISNLDYHLLRSLSKGGYFLILILLILVLILGIETRGSIRWIPLGLINIQPSEFAKPMIIIVLSTFWASNFVSWLNILKSLAFLAPIILLIFKQPDLGTTLTVMSLWMGTLITSRIDYKKLVLIFLGIILVLPLTWFTLKDYQRSRITSFLSPSSDPLGVGYNLIQSTIAVGSGELLGRGLGYGTQSRLQFLPEYRTDFIFASIAEEFGFLGTTLILAIYVFLISYCFFVASKADYFGSLVASGVAILLFFQTVVNIGMNVGILPITGITLPFISYGGSSLISFLISMGFVASVARSKRVDREAVSG